MGNLLMKRVLSQAESDVILEGPNVGQRQSAAPCFCELPVLTDSAMALTLVLCPDQALDHSIATCRAIHISWDP